MRRQLSRNKGRGVRRRKSNSPKSRTQPPQIESVVSVTRTFRFRSTAGTASTISALNLCQAFGGIGTVTNTTIATLASAVKLHRISIWTPPASQGAVATCSVKWISATGGFTSELSDTSMSTAIPAHVSGRPPAGSRPSFQVASTSDPMFEIVAPTGSVIDVHATWMIRDQSNTSDTYAAATVTLGQIYWLPLDGTADLYLPVSLATTT